MLSENELFRLYVQQNIPLIGRKAVETIRSSDPVRRVGGGTHNVATRFASRKMGCVIQAESHKGELPAVYSWEHDPKTFEFYDQPSKVKLSYQNGSGKCVSHLSTPDYFLIQEHWMGWVECKPEDEKALLMARDKLQDRIGGQAPNGWKDRSTTSIHGIRFIVGTPEELVDQSDIFGRFLSGLNAQWSAGILNVWLRESDWLKIHKGDVKKVLSSWWMGEQKRQWTSSFLPISNEAKVGLNFATTSYSNGHGNGSSSSVGKKEINGALANFNDFIPNRYSAGERLDSADFLVIGTFGVKGYDAEFVDGARPAFISALSYALFLLHHKKAILIEPVIEILMANNADKPEARRKERLAVLNQLLNVV